MKSAEIRQLFLDYFTKNGHQVVPSSSLVPANDPTLLFTNAGMVPFKECFLGQEKRSYTRATSSQRCVRAGGKHNDLENVGYTARHHTFFEMLGNFSFGDYFKREAIQFAWDFLTKELKLPEDRLWVTVYKDDDEAADIWLKEMKVSPDRFSRCGDEDNFWAMGDVGPCGPCTEIFYDHGKDIPGGPPGSPDADMDRYIEIWNLVFMQYSRDAQGKLTPLPKPSVDTGMGLERIAAVMQGVHNNYEIDIFDHLINEIAKLLNVKDINNPSLKVIADHIRSAAFLIIDGILPGNEGRQYVLRRIVRRAIRHGHKLGATESFFYKLIAPLQAVMGEAYPELNNPLISQALKKEEEQFAKTLDQGMKILEQDLQAMQKSGESKIAGETIFKLYDTYGFPVDLTGDIAREKNLALDMDGFEKCMNEQRNKSKASNQFSTQALLKQKLAINVESQFVGYQSLESQATVVQLFDDQGESVQSLQNADGIIVLDATPFYAESGGQVGDKGQILKENLSGDDNKNISVVEPKSLKSSSQDTYEFKDLDLNNNVKNNNVSDIIEVSDTQKQDDAILHLGKVSGKITVGDEVKVKVDVSSRGSIAANHSATHLLHEALKRVLGSHVQQKGSLVQPDRLRFDFLHTGPMTDDEIQAVERSVSLAIMQNYPVGTEVMTPAQAVDSGAVALFDGKYGDEVRVLTMGDYSKEVCGGTHVSRTGDIGLCKVIGETGIASGTRRIEAVTGQAALQLIHDQEGQLKAIAKVVKAEGAKPGSASVVDKVAELNDHAKKLEKNVEQLKSQMASAQSGDLINQAIEIAGAKVLAVEIAGADNKALRDSMDKLKDKLGSSIIVLASGSDNKVSLIAGVSKDMTGKIKAGELVNMVASQVGGKGGGRPDMAQAGGSQPENIGKALASVEAWVKNKLLAEVL